MNYYVGVDGGGTKTAICAASADASIIISEVTHSASWREYGVKQVVENIKKTISELPTGTDGIIAGIAMGMPCFGESEAGDIALTEALSIEFQGVPIYITNDVEVGWAGSLALAPGVNVVAGTGSIAFGKNELGETARCGGWSEFFSDEGSCYWVGRKVLELFSKQADGRVPRDELYDIIRSEWNIKNDFEAIDIIHSEYMTNRDKVASLQYYARDAALAGSNTAKALYREAARELCNLVFAIQEQLQFKEQPFPVSYSGGLFKTGDLILPHFFACIEEAGGKPVSPRYEPLYGALLLAFEQNNSEQLPQLKKRLEQQ
ncbi:MAG: ATPase [Oscillospiraceae bacterium]|nr:ATPase [Oscillospiraceae bacterium]